MSGKLQHGPMFGKRTGGTGVEINSRERGKLDIPVLPDVKITAVELDIPALPDVKITAVRRGSSAAGPRAGISNGNWKRNKRLTKSLAAVFPPPISPDAQTTPEIPSSPDVSAADAT